MSFFSSKFDTQVVIYKSAGQGALTGFRSEFANTPHPATGKLITGFQFDEAVWRTDLEDNSNFVEPTLLDSYTANLNDKFQTGVGDNNDLFINEIKTQFQGINNSSLPVWLPKINHGYFYGGQDEFYLFSDDGLTVYPTQFQVWTSQVTTASGGNFIDLQFVPKQGVPVLARSFTWNREKGFYEVDESARKVTSFTPKFVDDEFLLTTAGDEILWDNLSLGALEFVIELSGDLPRVIFNQQVVKPVGHLLSNIITYAPDELDAMELVGVIFEQDFQEHHLKFAPLDKQSGIQIVLQNGTSVIEYTVVEEFTEGGSQEVQVDWDLGILRFGSETYGGKPSTGFNIRVFYHKTLALEYEPINSRDFVVNTLANTNPIRRYTADGFVLIRQQTEDPANLVLTTELPLISPNFYGPLYIGNSFSKLLATVTTVDNVAIEGQEIFFEILSGPSDATFGADLNASAISNAQGQSVTLFNPPRSIEQMGGVTNEVTISGSTSQLFLPEYVPPGSNNTLFVFQVHTTDNILGIPKTDLLSFYENYIQEQDTISSQTQGPRININMGDLGSYDWIGGAYSDFIKWEILHRSFHNLATPIVYDSDDLDDLRIGKKTVIAVLDSDAINPHTGTTPAFVPLQPVDYSITDSGTLVNFDQVLPVASGLYKSYLVIGPTKVAIRAYTNNLRTGQTIYSNTIEILLDIPDAAKGLVFVDTINSMPSGLLGNSYNWDQENLELESVNISTSGLLPIGWRIRSPGITIASALDSITFLDINPLTVPADTISHEFEVD
jgi:hypothetical protein